MYGSWPTKQIDHINGIRTDNRIENLRDVSRRENLGNQKKHRDGKLVGAYYSKKKNGWITQVFVGGKRIFYKQSKSESAAHELYLTVVKGLSE